MKRAIVSMWLLALAGCAPKAPAVVPAQWQGQQLYTCCNIHYESESVPDANYFVGNTLPFGSPAQVEAVSDNALTFRSNATKLTLSHSYGAAQESGQAYFQKILVATDPHERFRTFPPKVQEAINLGNVERGMTREQVLMSLGYPPTHRTANTDLAMWTYWRNRWITYTVSFGDNGRVIGINGPAPSQGLDLKDPPPPTPAKAAPKKKR